VDRSTSVTEALRICSDVHPHYHHGALAIVHTPTDIFPNIDIPVVSICSRTQGSCALASVLHHRLGRRLQLRQVLEGVLIARSLRPLPDIYRTGIVVPLTVCFWNQLETPYSVEVGVGVILDRAPKIQRPTNRGLFEGREEPANDGDLVQKQPPVAGDDMDDVFLN
jgi:hypothetical protein